MRIVRYYTGILLIICTPVLCAQETISADRTEGCDSLRVQFTLQTLLQESDYTSIEWNFGDGGTLAGGLSVEHLYDSPGSYTVICSLNGTTTISLDPKVIVHESPYAEILFRDASQTEEEFRYILSPGYYQPDASDTLAYLWTLPDTSQPTDSAIIYLFDGEGLYDVTLEITNRFGCSYLASRTIPVSRELMVPNVFSPNGDKKNDRFEVSTPGDYIYSFRIYSRNGVMIFLSRSERISWDGRTASGQEAPEGVYYYVIESDETPVETRVAGTIHLYR